MKKRLLQFTIALSTVVAVYSCNNGPYDAHPDTDYGSAVTPPVDGTDTSGAYINSMYARVNGKLLDFSPVYASIDENGILSFTAKVQNDPLFERTLRVVFTEYKGPILYAVPTVDPDGTHLIDVYFTMVDTTRLDGGGRKVYKTYSTQAAMGVAEVNVLGDEGGFYRGSIDAFMSRVTPEVMVSDTLNISDGYFYCDKKEIVPEGQ